MASSCLRVGHLGLQESQRSQPIHSTKHTWKEYGRSRPLPATCAAPPPRTRPDGEKGAIVTAACWEPGYAHWCLRQHLGCISSNEDRASGEAERARIDF